MSAQLSLNFNRWDIEAVATLFTEEEIFALTNSGVITEVISDNAIMSQRRGRIAGPGDSNVIKVLFK